MRRARWVAAAVAAAVAALVGIAKLGQMRDDSPSGQIGHRYVPPSPERAAELWGAPNGGHNF